MTPTHPARLPPFRTLLCACVALLSGLVMAQTPAANYYVSPTGGDSNSGTTPETSFLTINKALSVVGPGQTIAVAGGTYGYIGATRQFASPVTILGYGWPLPLITSGKGAGEPSPANPANDYAIYLQPGSPKNIVFDNLRVRGGIRLNNADNITVRNCEVFGQHIFITTCNDILVEKNYIHDADYAVANVNSGQPCRGITIRDNRIEDIRVDAIAIYKWNDVIISGNVIQRLHDPSGNLHNDGIQFGGGSSGVLVENNIIAHTSQAVFMQPIYGDLDNITIRNNLIYNFDACAIVNQGVTKVAIVNNTIHTGPLGNGCILLTKGAWDTSIPGARQTFNPAVTDTIVANNVLWSRPYPGGSVGPLYMDNGAACAFEDNNILSWHRSDNGAHDLLDASPGFLDATVGDLRPAAGSAMLGDLNPASTQYAPAYDLTRAPRSGTAPSRGALETFASAPSAPPCLTWDVETIPAVASNRAVTRVADPAMNGAGGVAVASTAVGDHVAFRIPVSQPGVHAVRLRAKTGTGQAIVRLSVDGAPLGPAIDLYGNGEYKTFDLGSLPLSESGFHEFRLAVVGKNANGAGHGMTLDHIQVVPEIIENERLCAKGGIEGDGTMASPTVSDAAARGGKYHHLPATAVGHYKSYKLVPVAKTGVYAVKLRVAAGPGRGRFQLSIDGENVGPVIDSYAPSAGFATHDLGARLLTEGHHEFTYTVSGKNSVSSGYALGFDYIQLVPFPLIPADNLAVWLKADSGVSLDGGGVALWADQSGGGRDAAQAAANRRPLLVENALNGYPALRFDGGDWLTFASPVDSQKHHVFAVVKPDAGLVNGATLLSGAPGSFQYRIETGYQQRVNKAATQILGSSATALPTDRYTAAEVRHENPALAFFKNATPDGGAAAAAAFTAPVNTIGARSGSETLFGNLAELIVYTAPLSAEDRAQVEEYLEVKYALSEQIGPVIGISLDEAGGRTPMLAADRAGVGPCRKNNWNNIAMTANTVTVAGSGLICSDETPVPSTFQAVINLRRTYTNPGAQTDDIRLYGGNSTLGNESSDPVTTGTIALTGIPFANYKILVYVTGNHAHRGGSIGLGAQTYYLRGSAKPSADGSGYIQASTTAYDSANPSLVAEANYVLFDNLSGSAQTLAFATLDMGDANFRLGVSGIQIVPVAP